MCKTDSPDCGEFAFVTSCAKYYAKSISGNPNANRALRTASWRSKSILGRMAVAMHCNKFQSTPLPVSRRKMSECRLRNQGRRKGIRRPANLRKCASNVIRKTDKKSMMIKVSVDSRSVGVCKSPIASRIPKKSGFLPPLLSYGKVISGAALSPISNANSQYEIR